MIDRPRKSLKKEVPVLGFLDKDYVGVSLPHTNALVVTLQVANHLIHRVLVDNGSYADILYCLAFLHMDISRDKIILAKYPLMGFGGEQVFPIGSIELSITAWENPKQKTIMVKFLLIDRPPAYNTILKRMALKKLKAITSTLHLKMKFLTEEGVGEVKGDW
jgi:hypothetical protein